MLTACVLDGFELGMQLAVFRLDLLDARDEAMRVVDSRTFRTDA